MRDYALNRALAAEGVGTSFFTLYRNWRARRQMAALDDKLLHDLGILRDEMLWATRSPLSQNSQLAVEGCAFTRARH